MNAATIVPTDPIEGSGVAGYTRQVCAGKMTYAVATAAYLTRIKRFNGALKAFVHVDEAGAMATARALDELRQAGQDLGPLMGVPVAVKDLFTVTGMPVACGSRVDVSDLIQPEGSFVKKLRRAGCIILGKTRTTEFASGSYNLTHPTPLNPWSGRGAPIMPGGSSNGSATALAAGLAAFTIGSDTGGSVRIPAAFCGLVGFQSSLGRWANDGIFPLSPTHDSAGFFTHDMADAATVLEALDGTHVPKRTVCGLRLAKPTTHFLDDIDPVVLNAFDGVLAKLAAAGAVITPIDVPEAAEIKDVSGLLVPIELLATLGRDRVEANALSFDPPVYQRLRSIWDITGDQVDRLEGRRRRLVAIAQARMAGSDAWISPTTPFPAPRLSEMTGVEWLLAWNARISRCTRPANMFAQCAISMPMAHPTGGAPLGLQLCAANGADEQLIGIASAIEEVIGVGPRPDLSSLMH